MKKYIFEQLNVIISFPINDLKRMMYGNECLAFSVISDLIQQKVFPKWVYVTTKKSFEFPVLLLSDQHKKDNTEVISLFSNSVPIVFRCCRISWKIYPWSFLNQHKLWQKWLINVSLPIVECSLRNLSQLKILIFQKEDISFALDWYYV